MVWLNMSHQRSLRECLGFAPLPCDELTSGETFRLFSPDKVKERLSVLSHGAFRTRLCDTANMYPSTRIKTGSEAYTSKTCGNCGVMNMKLGSSEVFKCGSCGLCADRDIHAARNIFLRNTQQVITGGGL